MAKVHPHLTSSASPSTSSSEDRKTYTVWMKSLVLNSHGCTVYNAEGEIVYRIENYDTKCSSQVYLMDLKGKVLCTLHNKKKLMNVYEHWDGYKCEEIKNERPWFHVKKVSKVFNKGEGFSCQVSLEDEGYETTPCYTIKGSTEKSEFQIVRGDGLVVAQARRKQTSNGIMLGDDILSLEMEPQMDHSFIIALVVVHGLMRHKI